MLWLRSNPDTRYKIGDATHTHTNVQRADAVVALLDALEGAPDDPPIRVAYCFYQMHADCTPKLLTDPGYAEGHAHDVPASPVVPTACVSR